MMVSGLGLWGTVGDSFTHGLILQGGRQIVRGTDVFDTGESAEHSLSFVQLSYEPSLRILPFPATLSKVNFSKKIEKSPPRLSFHGVVALGISLYKVASLIESEREASKVEYEFVNTSVTIGGGGRLTLIWPKPPPFALYWDLEALYYKSETAFGYGKDSSYQLDGRDSPPPSELKSKNLSQKNWISQVYRASLRFNFL